MTQLALFRCLFRTLLRVLPRQWRTFRGGHHFLDVAEKNRGFSGTQRYFPRKIARLYRRFWFIIGSFLVCDCGAQALKTWSKKGNIILAGCMRCKRIWDLKRQRIAGNIYKIWVPRKILWARSAGYHGLRRQRFTKNFSQWTSVANERTIGVGLLSEEDWMSTTTIRQRTIEGEETIRLSE